MSGAECSRSHGCQGSSPGGWIREAHPGPGPAGTCLRGSRGVLRRAGHRLAASATCARPPWGPACGGRKGLSWGAGPLLREAQAAPRAVACWSRRARFSGRWSLHQDSPRSSPDRRCNYFELPLSLKASGARVWPKRKSRASTARAASTSWMPWLTRMSSAITPPLHSRIALHPTKVIDDHRGSIYAADRGGCVPAFRRREALCCPVPCPLFTRGIRSCGGSRSCSPRSLDVGPVGPSGAPPGVGPPGLGGARPGDGRWCS